MKNSTRLFLLLTALVSATTLSGFGEKTTNGPTGGPPVPGIHALAFGPTGGAPVPGSDDVAFGPTGGAPVPGSDDVAFGPTGGPPVPGVISHIS